MPRETAARARKPAPVDPALAVVENLPSPAALVGEEGRLIGFSPSLAEALADPLDALGRPAADVLPVRDVGEVIERVLEGRRPEPVPTELSPAGGRPRPVELRAARLATGDLLLVLRELDEAALLRRRLAAGRRLVRRAANAHPDVGVLIADASGRIRFASAHLARLLGYRAGELEGRHYLELVPERARASHPRPGDDETTAFVGRVEMLRRDGGTVPVSLAAGRVVGPEGPWSFAVVRDLSAEEASEAALANADARLDRIVETMPQAVAIHRDGLFLFVNRTLADALGVDDPEELLAQPVLDWVHPNDRAAARERLRALVRDELDEARHIVRMIRADGGELHVEVHCARIEYAGLPAALWVADDVTERVRAERLRLWRADLERALAAMLGRGLSGEPVEKAAGEALEALVAYPLEHFGGAAALFVLDEDTGELVPAGSAGGPLPAACFETRGERCACTDPAGPLFCLSIATGSRRFGMLVLRGTQEDLPEEAADALRSAERAFTALLGHAQAESHRRRTERLHRALVGLLELALLPNVREEEFLQDALELALHVLTSPAGALFLEGPEGVRLVASRGLPSAAHCDVNLRQPCPCARAVREAPNLAPRALPCGWGAILAPVRDGDEPLGVLAAAAPERGVRWAREAAASLARVIGRALVERRTEAALRRSERTARALIEQSPAAIGVLRNGEVLFANRRLAALLADGDDLEGTRIELPAPGEQIRLQAASGRSRSLSVESIDIDWDGEPASVCLFIDETERLQREADLRHSQKLEAVGQLAAGIAHEINTPIQFVGDSIHFLDEAFQDLRRLLDAYARLAEAVGDVDAASPLLREIRDLEEEIDLEFLNDELPGALARAREGVERVATIVRAMKEFSHPGGLEMGPADLNRAIRNTVTVARNEYKYVADLELDLGELPPVHCRIGDINQVVLNLVVNAAHAIEDKVRETGGRGRITIRTYVDGDDAVIEVGDTGTGIPEAIRPRIFDPFFTTKEVGRGSGQGLAIAYRVVVRDHGGSIHVDSREGEGTTFTVRLPIRGKKKDGAEE